MGRIEVERHGARAWSAWFTGGMLMHRNVLQVDQRPLYSQLSCK